METEPEVEVPKVSEKKAKKHKNSNDSSVSQKKSKTFSVEELKKQLKGNDKSKALLEFQQNIKNNSSQDVALEYLEHGGSVQELLKCLEEDSSIAPVLVLEIVNILLLKIIKSNLKCVDAAYQSCRYFLQNFASVIDKMLGYTSSAAERIVILKFLTTMAANSSELSKDILTHVNFNLARVEFLSLSRVENKAVRKQFVYFLTAVLIDIEYPVLSILLSKKNLMTSIIPGLVHDEADTVCFILNAMKQSILENPLVSKTVKMKTFNTIVAKRIVNLYNWKGPDHLKKEAGTIEVDKVLKAKVSECVHEFLITLCTSHKFGVIFRDATVGTGKKTQNALIYTIVEGMDSPWEHSYASELVLKICNACPDITKYVWNQTKAALEPRSSTKWLQVVDFVKRLLNELTPTCLEPYITKMTSNQIGQVITHLIAPIPVLKVIFPENGTYDTPSVKFQAFSVISLMLNSMNNFLSEFETTLNQEQYNKLRIYLGNHIEKNFPIGDVFLQNWNKKSEKKDESFNLLNYLSVVFDIFRHYVNLCPDQIGSLLFSQTELKSFLDTIISLENDVNERETKQLKVNIIDVFLTGNSFMFSFDWDYFNFLLCLLFRACYEDVDDAKSILVLRKLFKSKVLFEYGTDSEIDIWINGIFSLKSFKDSVPEFITSSIKVTVLKFKEYLKEFSEIQKSIENDDYPTQKLSPMIFGVLESLAETNSKKCVSSYINFVIPHLIYLQGDYRIISEIIKRRDSLKSPLLEYVDSILNAEIVSFEIPKILRVFGKDDVFNSFNLALASDSFESFLNEHKKKLYPNLNLDLLQMGTFYFSKLSDSDDSKKYSKNLTLFINYLLDKNHFDPSVILNNMSFIKNFSILDVQSNGEFNCCTNFIINFLECYRTKFELSIEHVQFFNQKLLKMLFKILKNPKKYSNDKVIQVVNHFTMNSETLSRILLKISNCIEENLDKCKFNVFYSILVYSLEKYCQLNEENLPHLPVGVLENLLSFYSSLNQEGSIKTIELSKVFVSYSSKFPESVKSISSDVVNSILSLKEYQKPHSDFVVFIFDRRDDLYCCIDEKLDDLLFVKGLFYPVLQLLNKKYAQVEEDKKSWLRELFQRIYSKFEEVLHKALRKPQKASQHLDENYQGVCLLIELNFQKEKFQEYISKVLKFEVTKIFHVHFLNTIFRQFIDVGPDNNAVNNSILTFVHSLLNVLKRIPKNEENIEETLNSVSDCFILYLDNLKINQNQYDFSTIQTNESFKTMVKFLLKYGISDNERLLNVLLSFVSLIGEKFEENQIELIMDMLISHSEFLDVLLSGTHKCKKGILSLMTVICESWPQFMARNHIPKLLAAYTATVSETDRMILKLLKKYESVREQVSFQDFSPFLWGNAGAIHYSVRIDIGDAILKKPKTKDVLNILQENMVLSTIKYYHLYKTGKNMDNIDPSTIYDLEFLLPLFIHLLAPENVVLTYHFAGCGALSLALLGLSSPEEKIRSETCVVLSRLYFHLESKQTGKDNILYMKLITGICVWMSDSESAMNNFASIFLARTALILSKPTYNSIMLRPLSKYLVKKTLDFSTIPELYTLLQSSDVNFKEHQQFMFEILTDGLIVENDVKVFTKSMALKLIMEYYSFTTDENIKLSILDILIAVCRMSLGVKLICIHSSLLSYLLIEVEQNLVSKDSGHPLVVKMKELTTIINSFSDDLGICEKTLLQSILETLEQAH